MTLFTKLKITVGVAACVGLGAVLWVAYRVFTTLLPFALIAAAALFVLWVLPKGKKAVL